MEYKHFLPQLESLIKRLQRKRKRFHSRGGAGPLADSVTSELIVASCETELLETAKVLSAVWEQGGAGVWGMFSEKTCSAGAAAYAGGSVGAHGAGVFPGQTNGALSTAVFPPTSSPPHPQQQQTSSVAIQQTPGTIPTSVIQPGFFLPRSRIRSLLAQTNRFTKYEIRMMLAGLSEHEGVDAVEQLVGLLVGMRLGSVQNAVVESDPAALGEVLIRGEDEHVIPTARNVEQLVVVTGRVGKDCTT